MELNAIVHILYVISSVKESGMYECIAENEAGRDSIQMEVTVLGWCQNFMCGMEIDLKWWSDWLYNIAMLCILINRKNVVEKLFRNMNWLACYWSV